MDEGKVMGKPQVLIITGISGSGKSTVLKVLEDAGYYCVDNVPVVIIPRVVEILTGEDLGKERLAFVIDVRGKEFLDQFPEFIGELDRMGVQRKVLFLDCRDDVLFRRYKETRRKHPLSETGNPLEGIERERELLSAVNEYVDLYIDTSEMNVHQLRDYILKEMPGSELTGIHVTILSFGFKYGIPAEADLVFDVRFLPNPHFDPALRNKTGLDPDVREYVFKRSITAEFVSRLLDFIEFLLPHFVREGKVYLTIAIGCTGGRHRSVALVEEIARLLKNRQDSVNIDVRHRDYTRE